MTKGCTPTVNEIMTTVGSDPTRLMDGVLAVQHRFGPVSI